MRWTLVIPAKALPAAKSRLLPGTTDPAHHRDLVLAIRCDTLAAGAAAAGVARILLVADRPPVAGDAFEDGTAGPAEVHVLVQTEPGLNPALREGAERAARDWPADGVAALVGDLPALRAGELAAALADAAAHARAFVPDRAGTGTTLLTAAPGTALDPAFGADSARRHGIVSHRLDAGPGLRHDVDTAEDLLAAVPLGLGPATTAVLSRSTVTVSSP